MKFLNDVSTPFSTEKMKQLVKKNEKDDTTLRKLRLISNDMCYGPFPDADEEIEQHLTILSDGRVWFSRYMYGECGYKYVLKEKNQINIGKDTATDILAYTKRYFDEKGIVIKCTDVGIWELFLTDEKNMEYKIDGSVILDDYTSQISNYIRKKIPISNMILFDDDI